MGFCSSITESKHIKAVKEPWRRSSRYKALGQMLLINQRLEKLAASRADFTARNMLQGDILQSVSSALDDDGELVFSSTYCHPHNASSTSSATRTTPQETRC